MSMPLTQTFASLSATLRYACVFTPPKSHLIAPFPQSNFVPIRSSFLPGSSLLIRRSHERKPVCKAMPVSVRCEQSSQEGSGLDVWLGRLAMIGFAAALTVEVATGKGLLENFGVISPLPTVALGVTALVGVLTAIFIFQSASKN